MRPKHRGRLGAQSRGQLACSRPNPQKTVRSESEHRKQCPARQESPVSWTGCAYERDQVCL